MPPISLRTSVDFWHNDQEELATIPGLEGIFSSDDLKGSLEDMPDFEPSEEVLDGSALQFAIEENYVSIKMAEPEDHERSKEVSISEDKKIEAPLSPITIKFDGAQPAPQSPKNEDLFETGAYDGTDTRSNPETPVQAEFTFEEGSPALKRVQSEQGILMSKARLHFNSPVFRMSEADRARYLNASLLNSSVKPFHGHGGPDLSYMHHPTTAYVLQSSNGNTRPLSRLRETTPVIDPSRLSSDGQHGEQETMGELTQHQGYNSNTNNVNNTCYRQDQPLEYGQHMGIPQYPDPPILETQHLLSQTPYPSQQIQGNVNNRTFDPYHLQDRHGLPNPQQLATSHQSSLSHTYEGFGMLKQESPELRTDGLVYSSYSDANQDRGTNTLALNDTTVPRDENHKRYYVNTLKEAMMDMHHAEDNAGMVATWNKMRQDSNKVEQACWALVEVVMRAYNPNHIGPLVANSKPNNKYESFSKRIDALVEGLRTQKTMCKHIMAPPYVDQLVDDPLNAITRIKNNRKVNFGKKVAIQKGRSALGEKGQGKGRRNIKVVQEEEYEEDDLGVEHDNVDPDCEFDDDEDAIAQEPVVYQSAAPRRRSTKRTRQTESEESQDPTYGANRVQPKKAKRTSRSIYQLNDHNEMVDTSLGGQASSSYSDMGIPQYGTPNHVDPQYGQRQPNRYHSLLHQAAHHNNQQAPAPVFRYGRPYAPIQPPPALRTEGIPQSQAMLTDFDDYNTTTDLTSGNEGDSEYHHRSEYGSDTQPGGASGRMRRR